LVLDSAPDKKITEAFVTPGRRYWRTNSAGLRIPLMADTDSTFIADSIPFDGGHPAQVS
jgi:hypothetical protein